LTIEPETFDAMRLVPKDPEDPRAGPASENLKVPLLSYGALNPDLAQDRRKCFGSESDSVDPSRSE
jgi:hypothetical protein